MRQTHELYRIVDANLNRSKEGLRVCEDIARYIWDNKSLTKMFKDLRHDVTEVINKLEMGKVIASRDVSADVGRPNSVSEFKRKDIRAVFMANMQRVKESLRVLEEISKLLNNQVSENFKKLRYRAYVLEQKALKSR